MRTVYQWSQLGVDQITSFYLYESLMPPEDMASQTTIRGKDYTSSIYVDVEGFIVNGPGRFALGSLSSLVREFYSSDLNDDLFEVGREYTKDELVALIVASGHASNIQNSAGKLYYGINIVQVDLADGVDDFMQRAYVWNSGSFKISDDARFMITADGSRIIRNYSIVPDPKVSENFDFEGGGFIAKITNPVNKSLIDSFDIGRTVNIHFEGTVPTSIYTRDNYISDLLSHNQQVLLGGLAKTGLLADEAELINSLWVSGVTQTIDSDGRVIVYGSDQSDYLGHATIDHLPILSPLKIYADMSSSAIHLLSGGGNDTLVGDGGADYLEGGADYDTYLAGAGDTIFDTDHSGRVLFGKAILTGGYLQDDGSYLSGDGKYSYQLANQILTVTETATGGALTIENYRQSGDLDIVLGEPVAPFIPPPATAGNIIQGDLAPILAAQGNVTYNTWGNVVVDPNTPEPGRADDITDTSVSNLIQTGGGNDRVYSKNGGDNVVFLGDGNDRLGMDFGMDEDGIKQAYSCRHRCFIFRYIQTGIGNFRAS